MAIGFIKNISSISKNLKSYKIGDLLVDSGIITHEQLLTALIEQKKTNKKLGSILLSQKSVSAIQLYHRLVLQYMYKVCALLLGAIVLLSTPSIAHASYGKQINNSVRMFGANETMSTDIKEFTKWTSMLKRYNQQMSNIKSIPLKIKEWKNFIENSKNLSDKDKLEVVNNYINKVKYIEDIDNYKKGDVWATPVEFFAKGGDCEDFAIAKYFSLLDLGFTDNQMRIAIVKDEKLNIHHAVLVVYLNGQSLVLDNQNKNIRNSTAISYYKPIFSINGNAWWMHETSS